MEIKFTKVSKDNLEIGDMFIDYENNTFLLADDIHGDYVVVDLQNSMVGYYSTISAIFDAYAIRRIVKNKNILIDEIKN